MSTAQNKWKWTGFTSKTLWDWLQLLIIPIVLAGGAIWFNVQQNQISLQTSERQHQTDIQIATDQQQEATLQTYLDRMSGLLLDRNLSKSKPSDEIRNVARAQTLVALRKLDPIRKGLLLQFLYESDLISAAKTIVYLGNADLSGVILSNSRINPQFTQLFSTVNSQPGYIVAYYYLAIANMHAIESNMSGIDLSGANLEGASLSDVDLSGADLSGSDLRNADLSGANFSGANLSFANLMKAHLGNTELSKAKSLKGTTMPDGLIHP